MSSTRLRAGLVLAVVLAVAGPAVALGMARNGDGDGDGDARSVIFINGDGMGLAQRQAATLALEGQHGTLAMDELPVLGLQSTAPDDPGHVVTDSAAAATAWSTGTSTSIGRISTAPDGEPLTPLGREVSAAGKATGLVTTSTVTDASPGAFFASVAHRDDQAGIAADYLGTSGLDVVLGGGSSVWSDDLLARAEASGFAVVTDPTAFRAASGSPLLGLLAEQEMWHAGEEGQAAAYEPQVTLADMTRKALDVLSQDEDGFLLFVEEEAIDGMGHAHNGALMLESMAALDAAVEVARAYVDEHPDTLLVVTGDHESGGLAVEDVGDGDEDGPFDVAGSDRQFSLDWTSRKHTGGPVPVTSQGPGSERLAGSYPNTWLHTVLRDVLLGS